MGSNYISIFTFPSFRVGRNGTCLKLTNQVIESNVFENKEVIPKIIDNLWKQNHMVEKKEKIYDPIYIKI